MDGNRISIGRSLRFDLHLVTSQKDQETSLGACMLDRKSYELLDEPVENHLARECLRGLDYRLDVQVPHGLAHRSRQGGSWFLVQVRGAFVELLHLAESAPAIVAVPRVAEMGVAGRFE